MLRGSDVLYDFGIICNVYRESRENLYGATSFEPENIIWVQGIDMLQLVHIWIYNQYFFSYAMFLPNLEIK